MNYPKGSTFALALFVLVIAGCSTTTHGLIGPLPDLPDPEQAAEIVVIREWRFLGAAANLTVELDGVPLYGIAVDEHVVLRVPPGDHIVTISRDTAVAVRAEPRRRYYYRLETYNFSSAFIVLPVPESVGKDLIAKTQRVE